MAAYHQPLFAEILSADDASRAEAVVDELLMHGLRAALTGGLANEARLRTRGRSSGPRRLNDLDFVVESFASIPETLADRFLLNHVHPLAAAGKTLLQLIDPARALRIDLFRSRGATLSRSGRLRPDTGPLDVVALEDLAARTTSHVYGHLVAGQPIDRKHATSFLRLSGLGDGRLLEEAWRDHREQHSGSFVEAARDTARLLALHPELVVAEEYSAVITPCERCQDHGPFRCAPPERIVEILGYW